MHRLSCSHGIILLAATCFFAWSFFSVHEILAYPRSQLGTVIFSQGVNLAQCEDSLDNDSDGFIDYPSDTDCTSSSDNNESPEAPTPPSPPFGEVGGGTLPIPGIISLSPANGAKNVSVNTKLVIVWTGPVMAHMGSLTIKKLSDDSVAETIFINGPYAVISSKNTLTFSLPTALESDTDYYIETPRGLVEDAAGNNSPAITGNTTWRFGTAAAATPIVREVVVRPKQYSADISWSTSIPTRTAFLYGTTTSYMSGSGVDSSYKEKHFVTLPELSPGTKYFYEIKAAGVLGGSDTYAGSFTTITQTSTLQPVNPSNFKAIAQKNSIVLMWQNPSGDDLEAVHLVRSTDSYPMTPDEGTFIYEGVQQLFIDMDVSVNIKYYYTIFARNTKGNYSSGAIASATVTPPPIITEEPIIPPIIPPVQSEIETRAVATVPPSFSDFLYTEIGFGQKVLTPKNNTVDITVGNKLKIVLPVAKTTPDTKFLTLVITDPVSGETSSYIFSNIKESAEYQAVISIGQSAQYLVEIKIFDAKKNAIADIRGFVHAMSAPTPVAEVIRTKVESTPYQTIGLVVGTAGLFSGIVQAGLLAAEVETFRDIFFLFYALALFVLRSGKKKTELRGIVYDTETKYPISMAKVVLKRVDKKGEEVTFTDSAGGFDIPSKAGISLLSAQKPGYVFPTTKLAAALNDEAYDTLYFGQVFNIVQGQKVTLNIPLDPLKSTWSEFLADREGLMREYVRRESFNYWVWGSAFYIGFAVLVIDLLFSLSIIAGLLLAGYLAVMWFQWNWKQKHPVTRLLDKVGSPVPYAIISVITDSNIVLKKIVTDRIGRFHLKILPGTYTFVIQEKQTDGSYTATYAMRNVPMEVGIFENDIMMTAQPSV